MKLTDILKLKITKIVGLLLLIIIAIVIIATSFKRENFDPNTSTLSSLRTETIKQKTTSSEGPDDMNDKNVNSNKDNANKLDPISNPRYNMQQVIKQSILLEEHLNCKRKRCRDCITKHFNHIIGLCEEAVMLSTNKPKNYCPHLINSVELYNDTFKEWLDCYKRKQEHNEDCIKKICDRLRGHRKKLITCYFFEDDNSAINYKDTYTNEEHLHDHMILENNLNIPKGYTLELGSKY